MTHENKLSNWAAEINKDWINCTAVANDNCLVIKDGNSEIARVSVVLGRYEIYGSDINAIEQLTYMINR